MSTLWPAQPYPFTLGHAATATRTLEFAEVQHQELDYLIGVNVVLEGITHVLAR